MPRYVILRHELPPSEPRPPHWDLMLESGAMLRTWALAELPQAGRTIAAESLPDHRRDYLDYEGPISRGRGTVVQWDAGACEWTVQESDRVTVAVEGRRLRGWICLCATATGSWELVYSEHVLA